MDAHITPEQGGLISGGTRGSVSTSRTGRPRIVASDGKHEQRAQVKVALSEKELQYVQELEAGPFGEECKQIKDFVGNIVCNCKGRCTHVVPHVLRGLLHARRSHNCVAPLHSHNANLNAQPMGAQGSGGQSHDRSEKRPPPPRSRPAVFARTSSGQRKSRATHRPALLHQLGVKRLYDAKQRVPTTSIT